MTTQEISYWQTLKSIITEHITSNDNQEITGQLLRGVLLHIVNSLGANATLAGIAEPSTSPFITEGPVFYIALAEGYYPNFNNEQLSAGEVAIFYWHSNSWRKISLGSSPILKYYKEVGSAAILSAPEQVSISSTGIGSDGFIPYINVVGDVNAVIIASSNEEASVTVQDDMVFLKAGKKEATLNDIVPIAITSQEMKELQSSEQWDNFAEANPLIYVIEE